MKHPSLSVKTTVGPDSSLKEFPLLYLYFDEFSEIANAWAKGHLKAARHDADIRSGGFSVKEIINDENIFLNLYKDNLVRLRLNDGTELRRDTEKEYWDRITHPEKYSEKISVTNPALTDKTKQELIAEIGRLNKLINADVEAIKLRYGKKLLTGTASSPGIAMGVVRNIGENSSLVWGSVELMAMIRQGDIIVAKPPRIYHKLLRKASAVVIDNGGRTCSVAIIARELGIPAITGTVQGTALLKTGEKVMVDGSEGVVFLQ